MARPNGAVQRSRMASFGSRPQFNSIQFNSNNPKGNPTDRPKRGKESGGKREALHRVRHRSHRDRTRRGRASTGAFLGALECFIDAAAARARRACSPQRHRMAGVSPAGASQACALRSCAVLSGAPLAFTLGFGHLCGLLCLDPNCPLRFAPGIAVPPRGRGLQPAAPTHALRRAAFNLDAFAQPDRSFAADCSVPLHLRCAEPFGA